MHESHARYMCLVHANSGGPPSMRTLVLLSLLTFGGCAGGITGIVPVIPQNTGEADVAFHLTSGTSHLEPVLRVILENRTGTALCVRAEALRNPRTQEMMLYLRDARGREVRWRDPGFIPAPIEGTVRIEPGRTAAGEYYLRARFLRLGNAPAIPSGWSARAAVRYGECDDASAHWAMSGWQGI